jgi:integrase
MTARLATHQPEPTATLQLHHHHWAGSAHAKQAIATAANERNHATLWSACAAMLHENQPSAHTVRAYRAGVLAYLEWAELHSINLIRPAAGTGSRYRTHLVDERGGQEKANAGSVNLRMAGARVLYRMFDWIDLPHTNPLKGVKSIKEKREPSTIREAYSTLHVAQLLEAATDAYDRAIILLGADAGLRAAEMIDLHWDGITGRTNDGTAIDNGTRVRLPERHPDGAWADFGELVVRGKGGTVRPVAAGDELLFALAALPNRTGPVLDLIRSTSGLRYRIARMAARAGIITKARPPKGAPRRALVCGAHRLRHRFGTDVVAQLGLRQGAAALRHASIQTTMRYAKEDHRALGEFARGLRRNG